MMKSVMVRAWEIARTGQEQFGGKVSEYLSESLKMAWAEVNVKEVTIATSEGSRNHKSWAAEIIGTHSRWKFEREFIESEPTDYREKVFILEEGKVYEICDAGDREFVTVINGEVIYIEDHQVEKEVA